MRLILVRHGETDWNRQDRFQGQTDTTLSEQGYAQSDWIRHRLATSAIDLAFCSDLQRAHVTAQRILEGRCLPLFPDVRLRERDYGKWEGLTRNEIQDQFPESWANWRLHPAEHCPEGGEDVHEVRERVSSFLSDLLEKHADREVLVVGHGGSVKGLVCVALGAPMEALRSFRVDNASVSELEFHNGIVRVDVLNDTCHLVAS